MIQPEQISRDLNNSGRIQAAKSRIGAASRKVRAKEKTVKPKISKNKINLNQGP
jgi:outer membrane protein TolC